MMAVRSYVRGWTVICRRGKWLYEDTGEPLSVVRPCRKCGRMPTADGHDACLGELPGIAFACCGHGVTEPIRIEARKR